MSSRARLVPYFTFQLAATERDLTVRLGIRFCWRRLLIAAGGASSLGALSMVAVHLIHGPWG
jgi:hypothetical protein